MQSAAPVRRKHSSILTQSYLILPPPRAAISVSIPRPMRMRGAPFSAHRRSSRGRSMAASITAPETTSTTPRVRVPPLRGVTA